DVRSDWSDFYAVFGDVDGDGWQDMYQSISGHQDRLYLRKPIVQGAITYQRLIDVTPQGLIPRSMDPCHKAAAVDVNRDGAPDIVYTTFTYCQHRDDAARVRVLINDGTGSFLDESTRVPANRS